MSRPWVLMVCGGRKPSCFQRSARSAGNSLSTALSAWMLVSAVLALNWISRSPWQQSASSASLGKDAMATRRFGRWAARPKRASNIEAPNAIVIDRLSVMPTGPSRPLSGGGILSSVGRGNSPAIRAAVRTVSRLIRDTRSSRPSASTSKEASSAAAGWGVTMPAWWAP